MIWQRSSAAQREMGIQPDRIRLLKFVNILAIGGTERQAVRLAQALDPSSFELHIACLRRAGHFLEAIQRLQVPLAEYRIHSLYKPKTFHAQWKFVEYLKRNRIQIVHTYGFYPNVFAIPAARLARTPVVVASIRDLGNLGTPMQERVQKVICRLADCVVVNAEAIRQRLIAEGYTPEKIAVIRNGIVVPESGTRPGGPGLRQGLGLSPHGPVIAVLCVLRRLKGIEYFLAAATSVSRRFPEAHFLVVGDSVHKENGREVVGDSGYRKELEDYARRLGLDGRVTFMGFRLDVPELLSEVTVSVLPTLSEGLSNTLLESVAAGVPVVATRVGGNPEVVQDGVTGLLVPPRDAGALADAICRLLADPDLASRFAQAGRRRLAERFSLDRMVNETERLYLTLLEKAGQAAVGRQTAKAV